MSDNNDSQNKKGQLQFQVVGYIVFIFTIFSLIGIALMLNSSTTAFLDAKNDMIKRDLSRATEYIEQTKGLEWYLDFWLAHPDEVSAEQTDDEITLITENEFYFETDEATVEHLNSLPYNVQLAVAKDRYRVCCSTVNYEWGTFGYGGLSLVDVSEDNFGFVYIEASKTPITDFSKRLPYGQDWKYTDMDFDAFEDFRSGEYDSIEFETAYIKKENNAYYYLGMMPVEFDGKVRAVMCLEYNWNEFRSKLRSDTNRFVILAVCNVVTICLLTVFLMRRIVISPLSRIQGAVSGFIRTKDSRAAREELSKVSVNNEIDTLADEICEMTEELGSYIKEPQDGSGSQKD